MSDPDAVRRAAVRLLLREVLADLAAVRGLVPPAGVLATDVEVPDAVLAQVRAGMRPRAGEEVEELGHAYESLIAPTDRKNAGAHYTPRALAEEVVEHALGPLATTGELWVADIAAGSGVFLLAAARLIAERRAEPLSTVVRTHLYGADIDPTAAEICRLSLWLLAADPTLDPAELDARVFCGDALLDTDLGSRTGICWTDRVPGLAARGGFDAVIGNPPFLGVKNIRAALGAPVRDHYARTLLDGESGRSDLVVFFLARAAALSRDMVALVLPDAVAEGDTARFGLGARLASGMHLARAETSRPWPGAAGVRISLVWLRHGEQPVAPPVLDGRPVDVIGAHLGRGAAAGSEHGAGAPDWLPHGYQATIVLGKALVLDRREAAELVAADPRTRAWVRDYLSGDDLVSAPGSPCTRSVLDLGAATPAELADVPALAVHLDRVRAERRAHVDKYPQLADRWWGFLSPVERLYADLDALEETIALAKHAKYIWPVLVATGPVFSNGLIVYPTADRGVFAFLASTPHRLWAVDEGGSRLNQSHRYNPSRLRRSYPFPDSIDGARPAGEQLAVAMTRAQEGLGLGVTDVLNRVHDAAPAPGEVVAVRAAIAEVDRAVLAAHGIALTDQHTVRADGARTRFGLAPAAEAAVKEQLLSRFG